MKHSFLKVMIYCSLVLPCGLLSSGGSTFAEENTQANDNVNELKNTLQKQEETIKQLQAEIKQLKDKIPPPPDPVAQALRTSWTSCGKRHLEIKDDLVKVTFIGYQDLIWFFDTGAERHAKDDLAVVLNAGDLKKATIEYYNGDNKLFSITGSSTSPNTKKHY